jgi:outer membrane protein assembly factor BamB
MTIPSPEKTGPPSAFNGKWRSTWKKAFLIVILLLIVLLVGHLLFNFSVFVLSPLTTVTATPRGPIKSVGVNNLSLQELWRWSGIIGGQDSPPKVFIKENFVILASWVGDGSRVMVFEIKTGDLIWVRDSFSVESLNVDSERVYVGELRCVQAYDLKTGKELWTGAQQSIHKHGSLFVYPKEEILEVYDLDLSDDPRNKRLYILNSQTGETLNIIEQPNIFWRHENVYYTTPWIRGFKPYLSAEREKPGEVLWQLDFEDSPRLWPMLVDNIMYLDAGSIYALNTETGDIYWRSEAAYATNIGNRPQNSRVSRMAYSAGLLYVIRSDAAIVGLDAKTGREIGIVEISPPPIYYDKDGLIRDTYYLIAASDKFVAVYYNDSQELIVFERKE